MLENSLNFILDLKYILLYTTCFTSLITLYFTSVPSVGLVAVLKRKIKIKTFSVKTGLVKKSFISKFRKDFAPLHHRTYF